MPLYTHLNYIRDKVILPVCTAIPLCEFKEYNHNHTENEIFDFEMAAML